MFFGLVLVSGAYLIFRTSDYIAAIYFAVAYSKTILLLAAVYSCGEYGIYCRRSIFMCDSFFASINNSSSRSAQEGKLFQHSCHAFGISFLGNRKCAYRLLIILWSFIPSNNIKRTSMHRLHRFLCDHAQYGHNNPGQGQWSGNVQCFIGRVHLLFVYHSCTAIRTKYLNMELFLWKY